LIQLEHKSRTPAPTTPQSFVFGTRAGRPLHQRNVLRALYTAQERARDADGSPTFPALFEKDAATWSSTRRATMCWPR
jgi:hypothetical protein